MGRKAKYAETDISSAKAVLGEKVERKRSAQDVICALRKEILAARRSGQSWRDISNALRRGGISASVSLLSQTLGRRRGAATPAVKAVKPAAAGVADRIRGAAAQASAPAVVPARQGGGGFPVRVVNAADL